MKTAVSAFLLAIIALLLSACTSIETPGIENNTAPALSRPSEGILLASYMNCQHLLDRNETVFGTMVGESCYKNCIGGCPNSGPQFCYYEVETTGRCTVFVPSRVDAGGDQRFENLRSIYTAYEYGGEVTIQNEITLVTNPYCHRSYISLNLSEDIATGLCSYFVVGQ